jgi:hypothetical protein
MATTDQLQKAQRQTGLALNDFSRDAYVEVLTDAGYGGIKSLPKSDLFALVKSANLIPALKSK